jgi:5-(hydroxymethyl)furfural/furfural oxidase
MGATADPGAVVDPRGRVIGLAGVTVADAAIMPRLPSANTNVPVIMGAEKIAAGLDAG